MPFTSKKNVLLKTMRNNSLLLNYQKHVNDHILFGKHMVNLVEQYQNQYEVAQSFRRYLVTWINGDKNVLIPAGKTLAIL